jgi:hypothetical protein
LERAKESGIIFGVVMWESAMPPFKKGQLCIALDGRAIIE